MKRTSHILVENNDPSAAIRGFLASLLALDSVDAVLTPGRRPSKGTVMPALIVDPEQLEQADPCSPAFMMNGARLVSRLTRKTPGGKIIAVLRPCEIRAVKELVKLKQAESDGLILLGIDCPGAVGNRDFRAIAAENPDGLSNRFLSAMIPDARTEFEGRPIAEACRACEFPVPDGADIAIGLYGADLNGKLLVQSNTPAGADILNDISAPESEAPADRKAAVNKVRDARVAYRDVMFEKTAQQVNSFGKLADYFAECVNCYNCRVACPVCYCRECVFNTDVFDHEPFRYLQWAERQGSIRMPADTAFYHLTRLAHMSMACVGCGQCSNACPNDIPVMEVFRLTAHRTQAAFDYEAGRNIEEPPPLSVFSENEFTGIVGITKR